VVLAVVGYSSIASAQVTPAAGYTPPDDTPSIRVGAVIYADYSYTLDPKTSDADGNLDCSYKGGEPGFIRAIDPQTLAFPIYDGNGMFMSTGNITEHAKVGMLFIDWEHQWRMRVNGVASIDFEDELMAEFPGAQFVVRVQPHAIFPNCPRYIHKMQLVERSVFVPKAACETPEPDWKDHFADVLPEEQQRRRTERQAQREAESAAELESVDNPPVGD